MAEAPVFSFGEGSPELVAYRLMLDVMKIENRAIPGTPLGPGQQPMDRHYLLSTYHECLSAVRGRRIAGGGGATATATGS